MVKYPALFLLTNLHRTVWYQVSETYALKKLEELSVEKKDFGEKEIAFRSSGGFADSGSDLNKGKEQESKDNLEQIAKQTKEIWNKEKYHFLVYAAPEEIKNQIKENLEKQLGKMETKYLPGNFLNTPYEKLQELFKESLKVY